MASSRLDLPTATRCSLIRARLLVLLLPVAGCGFGSKGDHSELPHDTQSHEIDTGSSSTSDSGDSSDEIDSTSHGQDDSESRDTGSIHGTRPGGFEGGDSGGDVESGDDGSFDYDTAWEESLPVYDCPAPPDGAIVINATTTSMGMDVLAPDWGPTGLFVALSSVDYDYTSGCTDSLGMVEEFTSGAEPDGYLFTMFFTLPQVAYPTEYQGDYPLVPGAYTWGADPSFNMGVGWYDTASGYQYLGVDSASIGADHPFAYMELCISRLRPDRISGTALLTTGDGSIYSSDLGPFFFVFDLQDDGTRTSVCYDDTYYGWTESDAWTEDATDTGTSMDIGSALDTAGS